MARLKKVSYISLCVLIAFVAVASLLSVFRNTESRYLKMLDFPRIQLFVVSLLSLVVFIFLNKKWSWYDYLLLIGSLSGLGVNSSYLIHYTPLVDEEVPSVETVQKTDIEVSIFLANVRMSNKNADPLITLIREKQPDLVLVMEVDEWWETQLKVIEQAYPNAQETVNEAAYGMTLYSKFVLEEINVNYLQNEKVPSFESHITFNDSVKISFHAVHPVPPAHFEDLPDNAGEEEIEMQKIGKKVASQILPAIVAGDINDVVWSFTDELTHTKNLLHDIRVGRGFYNSYNAQNILMRWPLDHIFVTKEFEVKKIERLPYIGSDHFPIFVELVLKNSAAK